MLFAIAVLLKPDVEGELIKHSADFNEQLGASGANVVVAGALRDENGKKKGYLALFEGNDIGQAREWLHQSPLYRDKLYERLDLLEYRIEVGKIR
jgi:uncharacterized protein YciI